MPLVQLCQHVWSLTTPDDDDCVDGGQMRTFMTMSQLPNNTLGLIWSMVDTEQRGKLDYRQLGFALGLMGQAQRGEELDPSVIGPATPPPTLHGLPPPADEDDSTA
ncbi:hypothetical protein PTSG_04271 [Salpingoeca rosetta]|uniref:EH domain-containing protein n=1 Tax=Salpingoeca rosetta (strain ATCC 50818 / BSB-021) TaxID=946362 RepID=F2U734_SALR5|nr:uncharacterized protein PTSG_04271 [Salpingoeca rosetta]EGD83666.1 hypothetical protein PTSG_04271 [Salpingoeca rosetta]|eukprot:XP_004995170.1 hypothetical protein PTSG_04271 [Salpingoeca rosetta]